MVGPRTQVKSIVTGRPTSSVPEAMSMDWPYLSLTMAQDAKNSPALQSTLHRTVIAWPSRPKAVMSNAPTLADQVRQPRSPAPLRRGRSRRRPGAEGCARAAAS